MQVYLKVENFGKIKSARINIGDYVIFIGNNNSGKTYLMELIYGVLEHIKDRNTDWIEEELKQAFYKLEKSSDYKRKIDTHFIELMQQSINNYLNENKERIIYNIFKSDIPISVLNLEFSLEENEIFEVELYEKNNGDNHIAELIDTIYKENDHSKEQFKAILSKQEKIYNLTIREKQLNNHIKDEIRAILFPNKELGKIMINLIFDFIVLKRKNFDECLFVPASRTGLLLLYREFFAKKADDTVMILSEEQKKGEYGLTLPVYNFLRFLQTYKKNSKTEKINKNIIQFIEEKVIDGRLIYNNGEVLYIAKNNKIEVPLYLTSSMVNELTPIIWALSDGRRIETLVVDEIETSLHPEKQVEMARLLNRMNNNGINLIISTHSDTMATKINNLLILSFANLEKDKRMQILKKLDLSEEDLLNKDKKVNAYQFINQKDGTSIVQQLEFDSYTGYNFDMFTETVVNLYEESKTIMEI